MVPPQGALRVGVQRGPKIAILHQLHDEHEMTRRIRACRSEAHNVVVVARLQQLNFLAEALLCEGCKHASSQRNHLTGLSKGSSCQL